MCGLRVSIDGGGQVTDVRGNPDDVWSQGHLCPKGTSLGHLHTDPDRLRQPMVRTRNGHTPVSWDDAYAEVERVLRPVLDRYGAPAVTVYVGNPVAHNLALSTHIGALIGMAQAAGMPAYYSPGTVDQWPLNLVSALLFGHMWNAPIPDVDRTDHLMILGANPSASQGSMLSAPDLMGRLAAIRKRGGTVTVVDPRRTLTAQRATRWVPIKPGTDALLLFAILHTLAEQGWIRRPPHLDGRITGLDDVIAMAADFAPESVAAACGIDATTIRALTHGLAARREPRAVQPHRRLHAGIRHARHLVGVRHQRCAGIAGPGGRRGVPAARHLVADVHEAAGPGRRRLAIRSLPQPGARRARGVQPVPDQLPRRGDRHSR